MTKQIEAMKLALEALEWDSDYDKRQTARAALREALAEQPAQQGPVDLVDGEGNPLTLMQAIDHAIPLYTSPPAQRTWVGLTDEEIDTLREANSEGRGAGWRFNFKGFARAIEAAHGIKGDA